MFNRREEDIINHDLQGWPIYKMNLRDIIKEISVYDSKSDSYIIKESNLLDLYPSVLEDDGMGYGVNEKFIVEFNVHNVPDRQSEKRFCNVFIDKRQDNLELWKDAKFYYGAFVFDVREKKKMYYTIENIKKENDKIFYLCRADFDNEGNASLFKMESKWIEEDNLEYE